MDLLTAKFNLQELKNDPNFRSFNAKNGKLEKVNGIGNWILRLIVNIVTFGLADRKVRDLYHQSLKAANLEHLSKHNFSASVIKADLNNVNFDQIFPSSRTTPPVRTSTRVPTPPPARTSTHFPTTPPSSRKDEASDSSSDESEDDDLGRGAPARTSTSTTIIREEEEPQKYDNLEDLDGILLSYQSYEILAEDKDKLLDLFMKYTKNFTPSAIRQHVGSILNREKMGFPVNVTAALTKRMDAEKEKLEQDQKADKQASSESSSEEEKKQPAVAPSIAENPPQLSEEQKILREKWENIPAQPEEVVELPHDQPVVASSVAENPPQVSEEQKILREKWENIPAQPEEVVEPPKVEAIEPEPVVVKASKLDELDKELAFLNNNDFIQMRSKKADLINIFMEYHKAGFTPEEIETKVNSILLAKQLHFQGGVANAIENKIADEKRLIEDAEKKRLEEEEANKPPSEDEKLAMEQKAAAEENIRIMRERLAQAAQKKAEEELAKPHAVEEVEVPETVEVQAEEEIKLEDLDNELAHLKTQDDIKNAENMKALWELLLKYSKTFSANEIANKVLSILDKNSSNTINFPGGRKTLAPTLQNKIDEAKKAREERIQDILRQIAEKKKVDEAAAEQAEIDAKAAAEAAEVARVEQVKKDNDDKLEEGLQSLGHILTLIEQGNIDFPVFAINTTAAWDHIQQYVPNEEEGLVKLPEEIHKKLVDFINRINDEMPKIELDKVENDVPEAIKVFGENWELINQHLKLDAPFIFEMDTSEDEKLAHEMQMQVDITGGAAEAQLFQLYDEIINDQNYNQEEAERIIQTLLSEGKTQADIYKSIEEKLKDNSTIVKENSLGRLVNILYT